MKVVYPYCRTCHKTATEISDDGGCTKCMSPLLWKPIKYNNTICPDCKGQKSYDAKRCKNCTWNQESPFSDDFRERIRKRVSEIADEMGVPNHWKNPSN